MRKLPLFVWILIALVLGVLYGVLCAAAGWTGHVGVAIKPVGTLFLNLLKMVAVPLVLFSLAAGVASLKSTAQLSRIGGKTIAIYLGTTAVAVVLGLSIANLIDPGSGVSQTTKDRLAATYEKDAGARLQAAENVTFSERLAKELARDGSGISAEARARLEESLRAEAKKKKRSLIDQIVAIVPTNPFQALMATEMLAIVFFAVILGAGVVRLPAARAERIGGVLSDLSEACIEIVRMIMVIAPLGVFALIAAVIAELGSDPQQLAEVLQALLGYALTVVLGLLAHLFLVYSLIVKGIARYPFGRFLRAFAPAQLLAFSSSSSAATLPVSMKCVEDGIGVSPQVTSFVMPLGATINMDGTALYQGVAAYFIAQMYGLDLTFGQQAGIVLTATLASIGTAAVPGVGIVMLTIVLRQIGVPVEGIALILGIDRPLDMCRTVLNVTGDAVVATAVARTEGQLRAPEADRS